MQDQHRARTLGQFRQRAPDIDAIADALLRMFADHRRHYLAFVARRLIVEAHPAPQQAMLAEHEVHRQPVQPGRELAVAAKAAELLPGADEGVLDVCPALVR